MVMRRLKLTRAQLAAFLTDPEQIRQFELLFAMVEEMAFSGADATSIAIGNVAAQAQEALAALQSIRDALELGPVYQPVGSYQPLDAQLTSLAALSYAGNALEVVRVNAGETGFELAPVGPTYTYATSAVSFTETATSGDKVTTITAAGLVVTLPTAVGNTARLTYKLMVAGTLVIDGAGAETIDTAPTATLITRYASITLVSDNANWLVI